MDTPTNNTYQPPLGQHAAATLSQAPVVSVKHWMLTFILCAIPIVNIVMLFVWAFGDGTNPNKRNYARASLLLALIFIVLYVVFLVLFVAIFGSMAFWPELSGTNM
ncbi:hypothetical protein ACFQ88_17140 [Paenibacillus sp. NPDC056579]|uniref:hypothetical protein n=1 Tax=Paenibacillus sp. NPDC056579 TaxID=3345871 RepID=UPI003682987E